MHKKSNIDYDIIPFNPKEDRTIKAMKRKKRCIDGMKSKMEEFDVEKCQRDLNKQKREILNKVK